MARRKDFTYNEYIRVMVVQSARALVDSSLVRSTRASVCRPETKMIKLYGGPTRSINDFLASSLILEGTEHILLSSKTALSILTLYPTCPSHTILEPGETLDGTIESFLKVVGGVVSHAVEQTNSVDLRSFEVAQYARLIKDHVLTSTTEVCVFVTSLEEMEKWTLSSPHITFRFVSFVALVGVHQVSQIDAIKASRASFKSGVYTGLEGGALLAVHPTKTLLLPDSCFSYPKTLLKYPPN